jgi:hydrogenase/urease accessory protein HupE
VQPGWLRDAAPVVAGYVGARTAVAAGGAACPPAAPPAVDDDGDAGVTVAMRFACPASGAGVGAGALVYRSTAMVDFDPAARQAVMLRVDGDYIQVALLDSGRGEAVLRPRRVAGVPVDVVGEYVRLGIEHIFLGYDHIAFLVAVLLWARRAATLVRIVTAFTLAHSLTLSLAALGVVVIPSAIVEPAIAGTIVVVAVENFVSRAVENRWMWTGALGLVHGFGFAAVLGDHGLPQAAVAWSLGAFNLGVELGQLAIVAVALPLMWAADRAMAGGDAPARKAALVYPCSALVAVLGLWWLAERTVL